MSSTATLAHQLLEQLDGIWRDYQERGPGRVDRALFEDVEPTAASLTLALSELATAADNGELIDAINTGVELARRCVHRAEGLCFVTGEAGLVPRRDLYEKFEGALAAIRGAFEAG